MSGPGWVHTTSTAIVLAEGGRRDGRRTEGEGEKGVEEHVASLENGLTVLEDQAFYVALETRALMSFARPPGPMGVPRL